MDGVLALTLVALHVGLGTAATIAVARSSATLWRTTLRTEVSRGYRDAPQRDVFGSLLPSGLLWHASGAVVLGSLGLWPMLWAAEHALRRASSGSPSALGPSILVAAGLSLLLFTVSGTALRLVARRPGATATARAVGGSLVALGLVVGLPTLAWPQWFGADGAGAAAFGMFGVLAGVVLLRAAGLVHTAELEVWGRSVLFDET